MTQYYSTELSGIGNLPAVKPSATAAYGARMRRYRATINLGTQQINSGDSVVIAKLPAGCSFAYGILNTDTSLGTSTISIGTAANTTKYLNAKTDTTADTPQLFAVTADEDAAAYTAEETVILTVGTANLPASGNVVVDLFVSNP